MAHPPRAGALHAVALLLASLSMAGCLTAHPRLAAERGPELRPEVFFAGATRGLGMVYVRGRAPRLLRVESTGTAEPDGGFRLDQTFRVGDDPVERRTWRMRRDGPRSYTGTLTGVEGAVRAEVDGNELRFRYRMGRPGVVMDQRLYLQPDGRTVLNLATVRVLGVRWARISEQIVRVDRTC